MTQFNSVFPAAEIDPFQEMTQRDLRSQAEPEEAAMLRSDENLDEWRRILVDIMSDVDVQLAERRGKFQEFQNACWRGGEEGKAAFFQGKSQYLAWAGGAKRVKKSCEKRIREINALIQQRHERLLRERQDGAEERAKKHAEHQRREAEISTANQMLKRQARRDAQVERVNNDRKRYRAILAEVAAFLEADEHFDPMYLPLKRRLAEKLQEARFPNREEETS